MKTIGILSVTAMAIASFALADDVKTNTAATTAASTTGVKKTLKDSWPTTTEGAKKAKSDGVPNFGKLNDYIWRSGQPTKQGYESLAKQGLKTVVNLREEFPQDKDLVPQGVNYVYIPIKDEHEPTEEQAKQFLEVASNPDNWPILVHCHGGEGRAGVMSAIVRHSLDNWTHDQIMKEVSSFRVKHLFGITAPMAGCQQKFLQQWETTACTLPKATPTPAP